VKIEFSELRIEGFKSFVANTSVDVGVGGGSFCFVGGHNAVTPALGANACGKSTIYDALCWCLYGRTVKGNRGDLLINSASNGSGTLLIFLVDGVRHSLIRTQRPNRLKLDDEPIAQDDVDKLLGGMSFEEFLVVTGLGQFNDTILDASPRPRLELMTVLLKLSIWDAYHDKAGTEVGRLDMIKCRTEPSITQLSQQLLKLDKEIKFLQERIDDYERQIKTIESSAPAKDSARRIALIDSKVAKQRNVEQAYDKLRLERSAQQLVVREIKKTLEGRNERVKALKVALEEIATGICPTCQRKWVKLGSDVKQKKIEDDLADMEVLVVRSQQDLNMGERKANRLTSQLNEMLEQFDDTMDVTALQAERERLVNAETERTLQIAELRGKHTTTSETLAGKLKEEIETAQQLDGARKSLAESEAKIAQYSYWQAEFRKIRLWILESALIAFEHVMNATLARLGAEGWEVRCGISRETGSGTTRNELAIAPAYLGDTVGFDALSGGEYQRMRVAAAIAMNDVVCARRGLSINFEFWDEPTGWLSESGIDDLLELLGARVQETGKQVWLADHRSINFGGFTRRLLVRKTADGSTIEEV
jgi:DNA repair exonuclease SbcCD ATPase subunit